MIVLGRVSTGFRSGCRAWGAYGGFVGEMAVDLTSGDGFAVFFGDAEPRLRQALVAAYGPVLGREATVDALTWAWSHRHELAEMENPVGYLFRVGQTTAQRQFRRRRREELRERPERRSGDEVSDVEVDVDLESALDALSPQQRLAVLLVHGRCLPLREVAELMSVSVATVREHLSRGLDRLRSEMEVPDVH